MCISDAVVIFMPISSKAKYLTTKLAKHWISYGGKLMKGEPGNLDKHVFFANIWWFMVKLTIKKNKIAYSLLSDMKS